MKQFDYKKLYKENYKNRPNTCFLVTLIIFGLAALGALVILAGAEEFGTGLVAAIGIALVGWGFATWLRFEVAVALSQKIVVADTLLKMSGEDVAPSAPVVANNPKVQELQKLRESNLITEEEYQKAIENIGQ